MAQKLPNLNVIVIGSLVLVAVILTAGLEKIAHIIVIIVIMNLITEEECGNRFRAITKEWKH